MPDSKKKETTQAKESKDVLDPRRLDPMPDELLLKLQKLLERNDTALQHIHTREFYRACITLELKLPSIKQRNTPAGRMQAMKQLKHFWVIQTKKPLCVREELQEMRRRLEAMQWEIRQLRKEKEKE